MSATQIAKRTRIKRDTINNALAAAKSDLAKAAANRYDFLTLEQTAAVAECAASGSLSSPCPEGCSLSRATARRSQRIRRSSPCPSHTTNRHPKRSSRQGLTGRNWDMVVEGQRTVRVPAATAEVVVGRVLRVDLVR
jgi:hypothetical protein